MSLPLAEERHFSRLDAVVGDELFGVRISGRNARTDDALALVDPPGDLEIQFQKLREQISLRLKALSREHGCIQRRVGVFQGIRPRQLQRAIT